jgi:hypothetical protein
MKILHINQFVQADYLNDMIFHGGRTILGADYIPSHRPNYMYKSYLPKKHTLYGRGFSVYCKLDDMESDTDQTIVRQKIQDKYFDLIVYGNAHRCLDHSDIVFDAYPKNKIIFLDGEDCTYTRSEMKPKGIYFKRECYEDDALPIGFSMPKEIFTNKVVKEKEMAIITPGENWYRFENEADYYKDYQISYLGKTWKKSGWDCARHYEIIANYCMPSFSNPMSTYNLESCPPRIMIHLPKNLIMEYANRNGHKSSAEWEDYMAKIYDHTITHCTNEAMFNYMMKHI